MKRVLRRMVMVVALVSLVVTGVAEARVPAGDFQWLGYRWVGPIDIDQPGGHWEDMKCSTDRRFDVFLYSETNLGGDSVRICHAEPTFCEVPMHPWPEIKESHPQVCKEHQEQSVPNLAANRVKSLKVVWMPAGYCVNGYTNANYSGPAYQMFSFNLPKATNSLTQTYNEKIMSIKRLTYDGLPQYVCQ